MLNKHNIADGGLIGDILHHYCMRNWQALGSKVIFYVRNVDEMHWNIQLVLNPSVMVAEVTKYEFPESHRNLLYGFMYIDPEESNYRDGTIPNRKFVGKPKLETDDPTSNRDIVFILNYLSYYRDMHLHKQENIFKPEVRLQQIWRIGSKGPFGRVFLEHETDLFKTYNSIQPKYRLPQIKAPIATFPLQTDGQNCGVYVLLTMIDFIITQWSHIWIRDDDWDSQLTNNSVFRLHDNCKIGTAFVANAKEEDGRFYHGLAQLVRAEMVVLMERLHCIFVNAYSETDSVTKVDVLGILRHFTLRILKRTRNSNIFMITYS